MRGKNHKCMFVFVAKKNYTNFRNSDSHFRILSKKKEGIDTMFTLYKSYILVFYEFIKCLY